MTIPEPGCQESPDKMHWPGITDRPVLKSGVQVQETLIEERYRFWIKRRLPIDATVYRKADNIFFLSRDMDA